ncbi:serine/threonine-protein kinase [Nonomuraea sp. NEAU-A123]|uniref:serine/threonine-protein kinase n=1 Tax=Nonomuraea sp. NEAU-A123 TaxID=2839649 RepID=UPI001BE4A851|nr:serine/threonine-protein kinase [Nonomuraea sp. NEAU-A123]MBT2232172.1 protein kinase [Nonomuraea sp. NEAU-A123]
MESLSGGDPQHIGGYWLAGRIGSGGQGVVYEAYDGDGRRVALKMLHAAGGDGSRDRFAKEAIAAGRVASFCTARVLAVDLDGPRPYIVSEYVAGPSLRQAVREGRRFTGDDLHRLATAVATALTAIHEAGVIHRDLKPDNVLLGPDGPRVIDFGIARTLDMSLTRTGEVSGTPSYMAPEVFTGQRAGARADVFAWGAIMVYAATGQEPFDADNLGGVMHRVLSHQPDLSALPPRLAELVSVAMRKDPATRPTSRELLLALVSGNGTDTRGLLAEGSRAAEGVRGEGEADPALGTIAEDAYGALGPQERELAAEVFLRLVAVDEDGRESGRTVSQDELFGGRPEEEAAAIRRILRMFSYVVVTDDESVALSRPALLRAWPRLRMWVDADREGLAVLGQITSAARHWTDNGRRDGDLLQGSRLEQALSWAATGRRHVTLTPRERDFLQAGTALTRKRNRRRALTTTALAVLLVVSLAASGLALWQRQQAAGQRDVVTAKQVAAEADRLRTTDPVLAMLLSVAAWRVSPQVEARSALMASLQQQETAVFHDPQVKGVATRTLSGDGRTLVSVSDGGVNVYDVRTHKRTGGWRGPELKDGRELYAPVLSRTGRLVVIYTQEELGVWNLATGKRLLKERFPAGGMQIGVTIGEDEATLAVSYDNDLDHLVDVRTGRKFGRSAALHGWGPLIDPTGKHLLLTGDSFAERALPGWVPEHRYAGCRRSHSVAAFSSDGATLACADSEVVLLDAVTGRRRGKDVWTCDVCGGDFPRLRFSPDGRYLAAFNVRKLRVWKVADHDLELLSYQAEGDLSDVGFDGSTLRYLMDDAVISVDLSPRATSIRVGGDDAILSPGSDWAAIRGLSSKYVRLWNVRERKEVGRFPADPDMTAVLRFDELGRRLLIAPDSGRIELVDVGTRKRIWSFASRHAADGFAPLEAFFSPDGRTIALVLGPYGQTLEYWLTVLDAATGRVLHDSFTTSDGGPYLPDGKRLATGSGRFMDVATGKLVGAGYDTSTSGGVGVALSSRGLMAIAYDETGRVSLWDPSGPTALRPMLPKAAGPVSVLAFSPSGDVLAAASGGVLQLWDPVSRRRLGGGFDPRTIQDVDSLTFSADGSTLYYSADGDILEIPIGPERVAALVCGRAGRRLTEAEWRRYLGDVAYREACPKTPGR